jgi:glucuronate isomerase
MVKKFLDKDFLLRSKPAQKLYHEFAVSMPIFDYHCHIPAEEIASDRNFSSLAEAWLGGDHYKWRAMRAFGIEERFITGDASPEEKFIAWAKVVPYTAGNPLFHWTHMELQRIFGVDTPLNSDTAKEIHDHCSKQLRQKDFSVRRLIRKFNVAALCTTDDPADSLEHHEAIRKSGFETIVAPAYRPDRALDAHHPDLFNNWVDSLAELTDVKVNSFGRFIECLWKRHQYFHDRGCRLSDYGLEISYSVEWTTEDVEASFASVRKGKPLAGDALARFRSAVLFEMLTMDANQGWVQQLHLGAMRNNNSRMHSRLGPNTGYDSMGDFEQGRPLVRLLDRLERVGKLGKTIVYSANPKDNDMIPSILGSFQDGRIPGKMQTGSAWWFADTKDGMTRQMRSLASVGLLSRFVGMLTDSRSFLSYPRHEYFRRVLCDMLGTDVERGELPEDYALLGGIVQDICYNNAKEYFQLNFNR